MEVPEPGTGGKKKRKPNPPNWPRNNLGGGQRDTRRYPGCDNYCHTCGFDIHPTHNSATCPRKGPNHKDDATILDMKGGCKKNIFHHPNYANLIPAGVTLKTYAAPSG